MRGGLRALRLPLHNGSCHGAIQVFRQPELCLIFVQLRSTKILAPLASTLAAQGISGHFDLMRGGLRPLGLPLHNGSSRGTIQVFRQAEIRTHWCPDFLFHKWLFLRQVSDGPGRIIWLIRRGKEEVPHDGLP